ncbi:hypothetical protein FRACA_560003 [Frankia canadensis]|uniref:Uncharacterized protein n=1 Tax=Frankia canadensis TaxID=1836972 RepID=A0A2I2KYZ1_9ACTN|nr:hypothetical protein [Frankia canadensis]SNQ50885.1 hypothetical protein FRACA_560003 [Frankia canadensis]SOU58175.1 hypothetical protein FRACA_560003 [Frankia canadensis]
MAYAVDERTAAEAALDFFSTTLARPLRALTTAATTPAGAR